MTTSEDPRRPTPPFSAAPDAPWPSQAPPPPPPPPPAPDLSAPGYTAPGYTAPGYTAPGYGQPMPAAPPGQWHARPTGPPGRIRPTGLMILLFFVTIGIWGFIYYYLVHEEMKRHSGEGVGGVIAVLIAIVFGLINPFLLSHEVGQLYERSGRQPPVTVLTALWFFPGMFIIVGPFIWFVRTNRALNDYWAAQGVTA
ncbi:MULTISPECIES: DUF4234 domain-containing protein [unclassified Blastococcus]